MSCGARDPITIRCACGWIGEGFYRDPCPRCGGIDRVGAPAKSCDTCDASAGNDCITHGGVPRSPHLGRE